MSVSGLGQKARAVYYLDRGRPGPSSYERNLAVDFDQLHTADDIAQARMILMTRAARLEAREAAGDPDVADLGGEFYHWRGECDLLAEEVTARAIELGLETAL